MNMKFQTFGKHLRLFYYVFSEHHPRIFIFCYWQKKCASPWIKDLRTPMIIYDRQDQGTLILTDTQYDAQVMSHYIFSVK